MLQKLHRYWGFKSRSSNDTIDYRSGPNYLPSQPQVSLITPTLNAGTTLRRTLQSAASLQQQGIELEHYIIDGGSTDSTIKYAEKFCADNHWCQLLKRPGLKLYESMNLGLAKAQGHFSHILNADDFIIKPGSYARQLCLGIEKSSSILIMGVVIFQLNNGKIIRRWNAEDPSTKGITWREACKKGFHVAHPGFLALTSLYRQTAFSTIYPDSADYKMMQTLLLNPKLQNMIETTPELIIAMASGGKTSRPDSILRGMGQLKAINKELGIKENLLKRYYRKLIELMRCQIRVSFLELPSDSPRQEQ